MSRNAKRFRSLVITVIAIGATNFAISYANNAPDVIRKSAEIQRVGPPAFPPPPPKMFVPAMKPPVP